MQVEVITLVNLRDHAAGTTLTVSEADIKAHPGYYRRKADHDAANEAQLHAAPAETSSERHHRMKAELAAEREKTERLVAEARAKAAEEDAKTARESAEAAAREEVAGEQARRIAEVQAENERLQRLLAERERIDAKVVSLRTDADPAKESAPDPHPEPARPQMPTQDHKPNAPHLRKREG